MNTDRYGDHWDKPFLFIAHSATRGRCCWCLRAESQEVHHALYEDDLGSIKDREIIGKHVFPVCKSCHSKQNQKGVHSHAFWITGQGNRNRNTDAAIDRLRLGFKLLQP